MPFLLLLFIVVPIVELAIIIQVGSQLGVLSTVVLLIAVSVSLDTVGQIEAHLVSRRYEGFSGTGRVRGRLGR